MRTTRRTFLQASTATAATALLPSALHAQADAPARRPIPSTREEIPIVGLGTWITFNVGNDPALRDECARVMAAFFESGGRMIDSSPMYGSSQPVIGYGLQKLGRPSALFSAEKVWTSSGAAGPPQIEQSRRFWGVPKFDLVQVHNLLAWKAHLQTLFQMKATGTVRYVGITTSEGRRHDLVEQIMRNEPIDFVQLSYNVADREAEARLLPLASERGIAVIVNRPFRQGALTQRLQGKSLPEWAAELGVSSWAQLMLKFILSHPAVTVAIPATTRVDHVRENLSAAAGPMPDPAMRERISAHVKAL
ncbi:twin-arginine translocation signal domain-containing protein [Bradyrhizobium sp. CSA112]|uniref:aldo/keto reductase n=1 Tax=Bradyrhizobium sp. CSA112 TaxID=2699170 RepID=UPI0023B08FD8|nr:aldo/keto reductase [Bradyrhizobium sp. CSA112]MDE5455162.1 twin-arginine translocation signal domain-containing protein [Bradyrhizobium sp. CSA112]